ncbi:transposase [Bifidobacterium adolescentis]|nr:transposase [Bifidobacterium adolescentis]
MREDRRRRYDDGFRREALELIKSGAGKATLARRLAIPVYTARNWIGLYRSNGEEAVMGGGGSRRYDWETKVAAARDHVENGLTKTEAMASKEIVAWDVSRSPDLGQQKRLPAMLAERLPAGAEPILHSDMGDGSTSTNGGGRSSNASASASP